MFHYEVGHVLEKGAVQVATAEQAKTRVHLFQDLLYPGFTVPGSQSVGHAPGIAAHGGFVLTDLDLVVNTVGDGQGFGCLLSVSVDLSERQVKLANRPAGVCQ